MHQKVVHDVRVLAVASGGGHWIQLLRLSSAWSGCDVAFVSTHEGYSKLGYGTCAEPSRRSYIVPDANRWQKFRLLRQLLAVLMVIVRERPDVIISTGASIGYFAIRVGRVLGARTIWVDSIANADELSLAGQKVGPYADLWMTQWPHLAEKHEGSATKLLYRGAVI